MRRPRLSAESTRSSAINRRHFIAGTLPRGLGPAYSSLVPNLLCALSAAPRAENAARLLRVPRSVLRSRGPSPREEQKERGEDRVEASHEPVAYDAEVKPVRRIHLTERE